MESSVGYESDVVLRKVSSAMRNVLLGHGQYERDGTLFAELPKIDTLRKILREIITEKAVVVDFGGGLGGSYVSNHDFFENKSVRYIVVEQINFVEEGKKIADEFDLPIHFTSDISECSLEVFDVLILSSVIQYLDKWELIIRKLTSYKPRYILIDRTPLSNGPTEIFVQENEGYYTPKVSYPSRILNQKELLQEFVGYEVSRKWRSDFDPEDHLGFLLVRVGIDNEG